MQGTKLSAAAYGLRIASSLSPFFTPTSLSGGGNRILYSVRSQLHCRFADINSVNGDKLWLIIDNIRESINIPSR